MMLSIAVSLIWLLALLAASTHVQPGSRKPAALLAMAVVFALALPLALRLSPQPNWIGVLIGLTAMWQLVGGPLRRAGNLLGAVCAALAAALQIAGGVPLWLAASLAGAGLIVALVAVPRQAKQGGVRDMLLIAVALGAPAIGLAADLVYGWHSAAMLNLGAVARADVATPAWAIAIVVLALLGGALRGIWKRR